MSVTKKISTGDYNIITASNSGNTTVTTHTLTVFGNLVVQGNTTVINVANISTADPTITLNSNIASPFQGNSGIEVSRGPGYAMPAIYWNETAGSWQLTANIADPTSYSNISSGGGSVNSGTANRLGYYATSGTTITGTASTLTWDNTNAVLQVTGNLRATTVQANSTIRLATNSTNPDSVASNVVISGNSSGNSAGGTGIYFNNTVENGELISKTRAVAFSIIFG